MRRLALLALAACDSSSGSGPDVVYVGNRGAGTDVRVVSTANRTVVKTIDIGCAGPRDLVADGDVWAVYTGGGSAGAAVLRFDTRANAPDGRFDAPGVSAVAYDDRADHLLLGRPDPAAPETEPGTVTVHDRDGAETAR